MKKNRLAHLVAGLLFLSLFISACAVETLTPSNPVSGPTTTVTISTTATVTVTPGMAAHAAINSGGTPTVINFRFATYAASQRTVVTIDWVDESALTVPFNFVRSSSNVYYFAFTISTDITTTNFNSPIIISGTVDSAVRRGTTLNLAMLKNGAWVDVGTATIGTNGKLVECLPSTTLPGILSPGTYLLYQPAPGTSTAVSNLGVALVADDGGAGVVQVVHLYDDFGIPLATPTMTKLSYSGASDIDGQALTPDGSQGIVVDGGNTVRFFSDVQTGDPIASGTTLDITAYGGDGDSVAIMPNGDVAVVSGDSPSQLLVVSGIVSGTPVSAGTISVPGARDGVVISNDGKVLLARGSSGLTVYSITGTGPYTFTRRADMTALGATSTGDGRNGIAISPKDSSRAVIIGSGGSANATLVTGLPSSPSAHTAVTLTGVTSVYSVSISPDGKTAIVGTNVGIVMLSGVDTGTLRQVGTNFAPTFAGSTGNVTMSTIQTLGITLDGLYVVVCDTSGSLLMIPFDSSGFSTPVGILNGVAIPGNDQLVIH